MLATPGPVPAGSGWAFEIKFDGVRAIGYGSGSGLRIVSRNGRDISGSYPEVAGLGVDAGVVVDGELVALDERGRPDFARLQQRMHLAAPAAGLMAAVPVRYVVFDLLMKAGGRCWTCRTCSAGPGWSRSGWSGPGWWCRPTSPTPRVSWCWARPDSRVWRVWSRNG